MRLIPKETKFFELFVTQTENIIKSVDYLKQAIVKNKFEEEDVKKIKEFEHEGDAITHEIIDKLNETFITPIDREDIHKLANDIDDITDLINVIANRLHIYKIENPRDLYLEEFINNISEAVSALHNAIKNLTEIKRTRRILEYCIEINRLENSGDSLREKAIMNLFENEKDPIKIIKWKEIYEVAETVLDTCEHVAKTIEEILVKNG